MARQDAATFDVVRGHDPALYRWLDPSDAARYAVKRDWSILEDLPAGQPPVPIVFHCRVLSRKQRRAVSDAGGERASKELAFKYGVLSMRDAPLRRDGSLRNHRFVREHERHALEDDALDEIEDLYGIGDEDILDIGAAVIQRSFLAQGVQRNCHLRDFSLEAARELIREFHAARKKDAEEASLRESSEPPKEAPPETQES